MYKGKDALRTPLGRVRGLGSAKGGTDHWWHQRITALALVPLVLGFVVVMLRLVGRDQAGVKAVFHNPFVTGFGILLLVALFWHLKLGLQVVIEDYVHRDSTKLVTMLAMKVAVVLLGLASILAVLKLAFGG